MVDAPIPSPNYRVRQDLKPKGLAGLSDAMLDQHWKLYEGYVTNTNLLSKAVWACLESGDALNKPPHAELQRRLGFEYNGMVLHEYYFGALRGGSREPAGSSAFGTQLQKDFGGLERWRKQLTEIGLMRGIGWGVTALDPMTRRLVNFWISDHEIGHIAGFIPIVVMDVWEHAYATDYGVLPSGRAEYVKAYFANLHWDTIMERLDRALRSEPTR